MVSAQIQPKLSPYTSTRIPEVLEERERSQAWLARKMGFSVFHVNRVLKGHHPISWDFIRAACGVLELPESVLFFVADPMHAYIHNSDEGA